MDSRGRLSLQNVLWLHLLLSGLLTNCPKTAPSDEGAVERKRNWGREIFSISFFSPSVFLLCKNPHPTGACPLCHFVTFPHTVGNHPSSEGGIGLREYFSLRESKKITADVRAFLRGKGATYRRVRHRIRSYIRHHPCHAFYKPPLRMRQARLR